MARQTSKDSRSKKLQDLESDRESGTDQFLTTNQGLRINDNQNSLKAGERGATLLEDFIMREKITHFDHERIPERIVHARGSAAHGVFQVYKSMESVTKAKFLCDPSRVTPVFVRFSNRCRLTRLERSCTRCPRILRQILYRRGKLRSRRQQYAGFLHSGRDKIPRPYPRRKARTA